MKHSLNLMSEKSWKREQMRRSVRLWSRALVVVMLLLSVVGIAKYRECQHDARLQAYAESGYEPTRQLKLENNRLRNQIQLIQTEERFSLALAEDRPVLSLIGLTTRAVTEQDGQIYLQQIEIEREAVVLEPSGPSTLSFTLGGLAVNQSAVTQLTDALREAGPFVAVEMSMNSPTIINKQSPQAFSIQCTN